MSGIVTPTYQSGFASPQRGRLAYPQLWRGCIGAWMPCLGQSGSTLRDNSGYGRNGTLVNFTADDWVIDNGYSLRFDDATNYVSLGSGLLASSTGSISLWFKSSDVTTYQGLIGTRTSDANEFCVLIGAGDLWGGNWNNACRADTTANKWHHVVLTSNGATWTLTQDGISANIANNTAVNFTTFTAPWNIAITRVNRFQNGVMDSIMLWNRALTFSEIRLLATRRGIACETNRRRSYKSAAVPGGFKAAWLNQRSQIIGGGAR